MKRKRKHAGAFTLIEVLIATALVCLLFFGAVNLFVAGTQTALKSNAVCFAGADAANAVARIVGDTREALWCALPGDANGDWTPPAGRPAGAFQTSFGGTTIDTGMQIAFPPTAALAVQNAAGQACSPAPTAYDRTQAAGAVLWVYRSDANGTPNAASGACVWMVGSERGTAVNQALLSSVNTAAPNAVQFLRPASGATPAGLLPYQAVVRLVSAYGSGVGRSETSEQTNGVTATAVTGKCTLMRNHEMTLDHEPGAAVTPAPYGGTRLSD